MSNQAIAITATGMVTGVGFDTSSSCAAIRATIDNFQETDFIDTAGEYIQGCEVPLQQTWQGSQKLAKMLAMALTECAQEAAVELSQVPIIICLAEKERPGREQNLASKVFFETQTELGLQFHGDSTFVEHGRVGALVAMRQARTMLYETAVEQVIVAAVDSLLTAPALRYYEDQQRLLTSVNSNGFIPAEGASALLLSAPSATGDKQLLCAGFGFAVESATIESELPLRADGLVAAIKEALVEANTSMQELDLRIVDVSGEHYWFKESTLALQRTLHNPKQQFDIWHPADCVGEMGAAIGPAIFIYAKHACDNGYSEGHNMLCHFSNIDGKRGAAIVTYQQHGSA